MATIKAAILGFGTVGQGIYQILNERKDQLKKSFGSEVVIEAILIRDSAKERIPTPGVLVTDRFEEIEAIPDLQIVFEAIVGEEPAYDYLCRAIQKGSHIITANKVMFAKYGSELQERAIRMGVNVGYEATTAGGVPIIKTLKNLLRVNEVNRLQGILNGTSNFILTQMRLQESSFRVALQEAQLLGYAEADPVNDISGQDAFHKLMILSALAFGKQPDWDEVQIEGMRDITLDQVQEAGRNGQNYRHIAEIVRGSDGTLHASVKLELIGNEHPLYAIEGVNNAIVIETNYIGALTLVGPGAGKLPTAGVMVEDYAEIMGNQSRVLMTV